MTRRCGTSPQSLNDGPGLRSPDKPMKPLMHGPMQDSLSPAGVELVWQVASLTGTKHGLQIDNETLRVAMGLRLGTSLGQPNECSHWNLRMTYSAYRVSAVGGVKGDVHSMLLRVAYFTYFWLQATYTVNCIDLIERDLTATSSYVCTYHGAAQNSWCGMPRTQTPLHPRMSQLPQ